MKETDFEQNNAAWQFQQWQQQAGESIERQLRRFFNGLKLPHWNLPDEPMFSSIGETIQTILTFMLILAVLWLIWRIALRFIPYFKRWQQQSRPLKSAKSPVISSQQWVLRSQTFQQQGDYYQACRCLYLAMIQQLHDRRLIPDQPSRTDEEYRLLVWRLSQPDSYESLLQIHQLLTFSDRPATLQLFNQCQQAYQAILQTDELAPKRDRN